jgi:hypothetical protein
MVIEIKIPTEADHSELQENEPQASGQEQPLQLRSGFATVFRHVNAGSGEKNKNRGAEVGDPAGNEKSRGGNRQVQRIEVKVGVGEKVPGVVNGHEHHSQTPEQVNIIQAVGVRFRGRNFGRQGAPRESPKKILYQFAI